MISNYIARERRKRLTPLINGFTFCSFNKTTALYSTPRSVQDVTSLYTALYSTPRSDQDVTTLYTALYSTPRSVKDVTSLYTALYSTPRSVQDVTSLYTARYSTPRSVQDVTSLYTALYSTPRSVQDVTSLYTALCVMGPFSRALMARLTTTSLDSRSFPFFTARYMDVGQTFSFLYSNHLFLYSSSIYKFGLLVRLFASNKR